MPLGKRLDCGDAKYTGVEVPFAFDIVESLQVTFPSLGHGHATSMTSNEWYTLLG